MTGPTREAYAIVQINVKTGKEKDVAICRTPEGARKWVGHYGRRDDNDYRVDLVELILKPGYRFIDLPDDELGARKEASNV